MFKLKDLGPTSLLLGVRVERDWEKGTISLSQRKYAEDMLETYEMADCKPVSTPMDPGLILTKSMGSSTPEEQAEMRRRPYLPAIGSLMYMSTMTRPDISYAVGVLARFNSNPGLAHWKAVKHLFRYIKGTLDYKLTYGRAEPGQELFLTYSDADHGGNKDNGRSTGGYVIMMGGAAVDWRSKLQPTVSLSTTEAEFVAASEASKSLKWMRNLLGELGHMVKGSSTLLMDNQSAVTVSKNPEHHSRMRHLDLKYFKLREDVESKLVSPVYVPTTEMLADIMTKALPRATVQYMVEKLGLR